jgi:hypothetical protein
LVVKPAIGDWRTVRTRRGGAAGAWESGSDDAVEAAASGIGSDDASSFGVACAKAWRRRGMRAIETDTVSG